MIDQNSWGHLYFLDAACIPMRAGEMMDHSYAITSSLLPHYFPITSPLFPITFIFFPIASQLFPNFANSIMFSHCLQKGAFEIPPYWTQAPSLFQEGLMMCNVWGLLSRSLSASKFAMRALWTGVQCSTLQKLELSSVAVVCWSRAVSIVVWVFFEKAFLNRKRSLRREALRQPWTQPWNKAQLDYTTSKKINQ